MQVRTVSPRLDEYRRMILEMLFAERNHVCSVCVSNGHCEMQWLAQELGIDHIRYPVYLSEAAGGCQPRAVLCWIITAASCARAACGSATKSKARTPGT